MTLVAPSCRESDLGCAPRRPVLRKKSIRWVRDFFFADHRDDLHPVLCQNSALLK